MYDGTRVLLDAYDRLLSRKRDIFRSNFRRGEIYNNGSRGINCAGSYPTAGWEHGSKITEYLRNVRRTRACWRGGSQWLTFVKIGLSGPGL